jgi:6-hydroxycyclohex-1-ene-1-carbonyl-CoA dehydrogenase
VVVAVAGCGVCHTDLGYYYDGVRTNQPLPLALGHEISGRVVAAGDGAEEWLGRAVIVPAVLPCGECDLCRRGLARSAARRRCRATTSRAASDRTSWCRRAACARSTSAAGGRADAAAGLDRRRRADHALPGGAARRRRAGRPRVVVGVGGVGGYCVQVARAFGAEVVAIDVDAAQARRDRADGGAALALNARTRRRRR